MLAIEHPPRGSLLRDRRGHTGPDVRARSGRGKPPVAVFDRVRECVDAAKPRARRVRDGAVRVRGRHAAGGLRERSEGQRARCRLALTPVPPGLVPLVPSHQVRISVGLHYAAMQEQR